MRNNGVSLGIATAELHVRLDRLERETSRPVPRTVEVLERFTFADGIRWAWVTYRLGHGERRCVGVRGLS